MNRTTRWVLAAALSLSACGGSEAEPEAERGVEASGGDEGLPPEPRTAERETMTAEECEAQGGEVVGDIGDGAIHRPDYVCPSGQPPIADVPLGVEGSVCCPP